MSPSTLLKIGDRVRFKLDDDTLGTVTDVSWNNAQITWDDGVISIMTRDLEALAEVLDRFE